jgi:enamine deaminase RidA (YjgF/YER057c/UK114 family)
VSPKQLPAAVEPAGWPRPRGYSNGMVAEGRLLFVAGQVGWDPASPTPTFSPSFATQFAQALGNVLAVVRTAGGNAKQIARLTVYVTDKKEYLGALKDIGAAWRLLMGTHFPAMALVQVSGLVEDQAKVEIEATAVL